MKILVVHYSRTGHTARLAGVLATRFASRGADVSCEAIRVVRDWNKWLLPLPLLPLLPFLPLYLLSAGFRRFWHRVFHQPAQAIRPLRFPDVSGFDCVLIGTPKWLYVSYPVARWIGTVEGLPACTVHPFATFCGPPLKVFELEMLFVPLAERLTRRGAKVGATLAISSDYHPYFVFGEMQRLFRWLSQRVFDRPLKDFTLDGEVGREQVERFCAEVMGWPAARARHAAGPGATDPPSA